VTAAILAGGLGTRLRSVIGDHQKTVALVGGRPHLAFVLDQVALCGVSQAVLCVGYRAEEVHQQLGDRHGKISLTYSRESEPLGTGGALQLAATQIGSTHVLAMNGDSICGMDIADFVAMHLASGAPATLAVTAVKDVSRYGCVSLDETGKVLEMTEKAGPAGPGLVNAGVYVIRRSLLVELPSVRPLSLERDVFPRWIGKGLRAIVVRGPLIDMGTVDGYRIANAMAERGDFQCAISAGGLNAC